MIGAMQGKAASGLKRLRESLPTRLSIGDAAARLGMGKSTYQNYEDEYKKDYLPLWFVSKLVDVFVEHGADEREVWNLAGINDLFIKKTHQLIVSHTRASHVNVTRVAEVGLWRDTKMKSSEETRAVVMAPDPEFPDCERYGVTLSGGIADLVAPDGFTGICIPLASIDRLPRHKEIVCVIWRDGRGREETTVRRYMASNGKVWLASLSSRSELAEPIEPGRNERGDEIVVDGIVRSFFLDVSV